MSLIKGRQKCYGQTVECFYNQAETNTDAEPENKAEIETSRAENQLRDGKTDSKAQKHCANTETELDDYAPGFSKRVAKIGRANSQDD